MSREDQKKAVNTGILKNEVCRSWYEDGMFEIGVGVLFLFIALGLYLGFRFGLPAHFNLIVKLLWSAAYIGLGFGTFWLIRKLKEKLVWNKAGYSVIRDSYPKISVVFLFLGLFFLFFSIYGHRFLTPEIRILSTGTGLCFAFISQFYQAGKTRRLLFFCILPIFIAAVNIFLDVSWELNLYFQILIIGLALIASGSIAYREFKRNPTE
jgi:hypothetical protein